MAVMDNLKDTVPYVPIITVGDDGSVRKYRRVEHHGDIQVMQKGG